MSVEFISYDNEPIRFSRKSIKILSFKKKQFDYRLVFVHQLLFVNI
jgi:hypothetical protein